MHVIIIGGGTGGMCLAHGLKRAGGVSVAVYERYGARDDGLYGYRVGIDPTGNRALRECLPPAVYQRFVDTCAAPPRRFNVYSGKLRRTASFELPDTTSALDVERSVSRATLRQVLFTGMDDVLHFGKVFTHYQREQDGRVTAFFEDGTSATGDVLISAEGTWSAVRGQYLPHAAVQDTGISAIGTKTPMTSETRALLPTEAREGLSLIFGDNRVMGILHVMAFQDADVEDYISLSVWTADKLLPGDPTSLRGEQIKDFALRLTTGWHPNLRRILELADPKSAFPVKIATSAPIEPWQTTNVTLLGDAIHTMTPGQGVGANTALRDAMLLCRELTAAQTGRKTLLEAVGDYEAEMIPYGFARVRDSLKNNGTSGDDPLYRPVVGWFALFAARRFFSVTSKVPPLRRRFLAQLSTYRGAEDE